MRLLLDTHVMLWFAAGDERCSPATRALIEDERNEVAVSVVSVWEVAIKARLGRGEPMGVTSASDLRLVEDAQFALVNVLPLHALAAEELPVLHDDPFDRLLVATALADTWCLVSADHALAAYGDVVIPA